MQQCLFCGHMVTLVHVHGHYQCPVCCTNALPCCDGDNCHTNMLMDDHATEKNNPGEEVLTNLEQ
ncbi:MAG: hypothetical protein K2X48_02765 [Chitinophagaceae bacterium]|nr:hypothetical protein [Chitinophagaceae bacterium]